MTANADISGPAPDAGGDPAGSSLASADLAELYVMQGEYERGITMYRELIAANPDDASLRERMQDAEALADLLIIREAPAGGPPPARAARAASGGAANAEKIARLSAWLERIREWQ